jgi:hypothetical protein
MTREENMTITKKRVLVLLVVGVVTGAVLAAGQQRTQVTLRIATRLGVETDFAAGPTKVDDSLLQSLVGYTARIPVEIAPGLYASIPPWDLKEATFAGGTLLITLVNGATLKGRGIGSLQSESGQSFGLNTVSRLSVVEMTKDWDAVWRNDKITGERWKLTVGSGNGQSFEVRRPRFVFSYYSTSGYAMGGSDRTETNGANFWLKQGVDELEAPLETFRSIRIETAVQPASTTISVTAPNGTVTTGQLVLKRQDDRGWHTAVAWGVHAFLDGAQRTSILATRNSISLERIQ